MHDPTEFQDCCQLFAESFEISMLPAMRSVEREVLGCDYGATSWTTRGQARKLANALALGPGVRLLDIGAGTGWPGLFLASERGCDVTLLDLPASALAVARQRAQADGVERQVRAIAGSGDALPLAENSFDVISHSDVLCCLPEKEAVLAECRRVATPGARMFFYVIEVTPGLSDQAKARAVEAGPPFVDAPGDYPQLLARSGWKVMVRDDVTAEYRDSLAKLVRAFDADRELGAALGEDYLLESRVQRMAQIAAIDDGLLLRETCLATVC
jgi:SAM-dependent methyltransferase